MAFRVVDAKHAYERALSLGAEPGEIKVGPMELAFRRSRASAARCCISSIATATRARSGTSISAGPASATEARRRRPLLPRSPDPQCAARPHGPLGRLVRKLFNFRQIRFFNIEGKLTGLISRAMTSPCGKIRIPINESLDDKSQIEEYLRSTRARASSTSPWARATSTRPSRSCAATACRSCRRRPRPITRRSMRGCPVTASRSNACSNPAC